MPSRRDGLKKRKKSWGLCSIWSSHKCNEGCRSACGWGEGCAMEEFCFLACPFALYEGWGHLQGQVGTHCLWETGDHLGCRLWRI